MKTLTAILAVLVLAVTSAFAASDYLLKIEGVKGEVYFSGPLSSSATIPVGGQVGKITVTKGGVEVCSWSFGASNPTSVGSSGMGAGKVSMSDLSVTKKQSQGVDFGQRTVYVCPKGSPAITDQATWSSSSTPSIKFDLSSSSVSYTCNSASVAGYDLKAAKK
ncbi:MAG: hypothetical protein JNL32_03725 [Candidatus Kapabacteria bacterium]|nr:hypothetical protein [Candidatus Kapabacteria bacterium]